MCPQAYTIRAQMPFHLIANHIKHISANLLTMKPFLIYTSNKLSPSKANKNLDYIAFFPFRWGVLTQIVNVIKPCISKINMIKKTRTILHQESGLKQRSYGKLQGLPSSVLWPCSPWTWSLNLLLVILVVLSSLLSPYRIPLLLASIMDSWCDIIWFSFSISKTNQLLFYFSFFHYML